VAFESTDGSTLYFVRRAEEGFTIWKIPIEGGEESQVLSSLELPHGFRVFDDGIYFIRFSPSGRSFSFYDFATGQTGQIIQDFKYQAWSVSPDQKWLLVTKQQEAESDLFLVEDFR